MNRPYTCMFVKAAIDIQHSPVYISWLKYFVTYFYVIIIIIIIIINEND